MNITARSGAAAFPAGRSRPAAFGSATGAVVQAEAELTMPFPKTR